MEAVGLIAAENFLIGYKAWNECCPPFSYCLIPGKVLGIWLLEESTAVFVAAVRIVVFDSKHAMPRRAGIGSRICINMSATRAGASVPPRRAVFPQGGTTLTALSGALLVVDIIQFAATMANQDVFRVTRVIGNKIAGKQVYRKSTSIAVCCLDPKKVFDRNVTVTKERAVGSIGGADLLSQRLNQRTRGRAIGFQIQVFNLFANNPRSHWIDVKSLHVATELDWLQAEVCRRP